MENQLSALLGGQARRGSPRGAPDDVDQLKARIAQLEQQVPTLGADLAAREGQLDAARAANRGLTKQVDGR